MVEARRERHPAARLMPYSPNLCSTIRSLLPSCPAPSSADLLLRLPP